MWSPWRSEHIEHLSADSPADTSSLFRRIAESDRDEENLVVWRGRLTYVVMNRFPYNNGHLLIVPLRQVGEYDRLSAEERAEVADVIGSCIGWLREALDPEGFNVGINIGEAAGAGVPGHLHVHVVPRWSGDTNFMPTVADVKVVPEAIADTYRKLKAAAESDR